VTEHGVAVREVAMDKREKPRGRDGSRGGKEIGPDKAALDALDVRLRAARERASEPPSSAPRLGGGGAGVRVALDVVGVAVGAGLGIMLDRWLGTQPWFLLGLFVLGAAAGFRNVLRFAESQARDAGTAQGKPAAASKTDEAPPPKG
jgi:ATP synthase protein I